MAQETAPEAPAATETKPDPNMVVAKIAGEPVTRQQVIDSASDLPPQVLAQIDRVFPQLVDRYIGLTLIGKKAREENLQDDPEVKKRVAAFEEDAIRQMFVGRVLKEQVTDEAIKARYEEKVKDAAQIEEVSAAHILVASEDEAKKLIEEIKGGADFAQVAKDKSTDKGSGANGGELGWFTKEMMVPEFADAAFAMKAGEVSAAPVKSQFGWHIIKVAERRTKAPPTLDEMKSNIQAELSEEAMQKVVNDLRKAAEVEVMTPEGKTQPAQ